MGVPDEAAALGRRQLDSAGVKPNLVKTETKKEQRRIRTRVVKIETAAKRKSTMIVKTHERLIGRKYAAENSCQSDSKKAMSTLISQNFIIYIKAR